MNTGATLKEFPLALAGRAPVRNNTCCELNMLKKYLKTNEFMMMLKKKKAKTQQSLLEFTRIPTHSAEY